MQLIRRNECLFCSFFLIFCIIFVSHDSLLFGTNKNQTFIFFKYFYAASLTAVMLFADFFRSKNFQKKSFDYCFLMLIISSINMIATQDFSLGNIYRMMMFPYAMCIVRRISLENFKHIYDTIMTLVCSISLILFFVQILFPMLMDLFPIVANSGDFLYYSIGIFNGRVIPEFRNYGFAREPGVFQAFIALALLIQISPSFKTNYYKISLYLLTMLTTFSTTGYIIAIVWLVLVFYEEKNFFGKKTLFLLFLGICGGFLFLYFDLMPLIDSMSVFSKLSNSSGYTTASRYTSIVSNLYICLHHPLFGVGIQKVGEISPLLSYDFFGVYAESNTNTIFYHFSSQGILYALLWAIPYFLFAKRLFVERISYLLGGGILLLMCFGELFCYSGLFYLLIFYSFENNCERFKCQF